VTAFAPGALVRARGREWVVLPESADDLVLVRPLGGTADETTGILPAIEPVQPATFAWPDPTRPGDHRSAWLLRQALRLGFRSSAGPFRSFGSIAVEPRPYQLVPLLIALRQHTTRLLIADDVGIGKTVEALLIARELLETGAATRLAVLCPPHLAEQWQRELADKFHLPAELVLPSTAPRLERACAVGQTLFEIYPYVIVSTDYIKAERRRAEFLRTCPELVIVDEAHTCAADTARRSARHQRHELVAGLAGDPARHLILVTATPHSGSQDEGVFRSLLRMLDPSFAELPTDLSGPGNQHLRRRLAEQLVQRRRPDIAAYLDEQTPFPKREDAEASYTLHPDYRALFDRALAYARETVREASGGQHRQRVRWWSALALLRSLASSPAAAAATLRARADTAATATAEEADELGRRSVLDAGDDDTLEGIDVAPGADPTPPGEAGDPETDTTTDLEATRVRRRLLDMARLADSLQGSRDAKLRKAIKVVDGLVGDGFNPIVFCRFIPTADYVAAALRTHFGDRVAVTAVTGTLPPAGRESRVAELAEVPRRVLVATDCLSEGINLQDHFDAVLHYDLAWSPTRHEQREGRVDRFGQPSELVRVITYYGTDNQIDGIVLDVLLRKHRQIRKRLGVAIPVPAASTEVMEAIFEGLLLRERHGADLSQLTLFDELSAPKAERLHLDWEDAAQAESRSQTIFAQHAIKVDEVARELAAARDAIGAASDVEEFVRAAVAAHGGVVAAAPGGALDIVLDNSPTGLRDAVRGQTRLRGRFELPLRADHEVYLSRTHPFVEGLASYLLTSALDSLEGGVAARCGALRTSAVDRRTTLLLVRYRFDITTIRPDRDQELLAEDAAVLAFSGPPEDPTWLPPDAVAPLLEATPAGNLPAEQASRFIVTVLDAPSVIAARLAQEARRRAEELLATHRRIRTQSGARGVRYRVTPHLPPDVLGVYVLLPPAPGRPSP
jgi:superfamily II DNA or RNA helicase